MMATVDDLERRAFLAGDRQILALLELMEQTAKRRVEALADLLDRLATDPPERYRAGVEFDSALRRACGVGRT